MYVYIECVYKYVCVYIKCMYIDVSLHCKVIVIVA